MGTHKHTPMCLCPQSPGPHAPPCVGKLHPTAPTFRPKSWICSPPAGTRRSRARSLSPGHRQASRWSPTASRCSHSPFSALEPKLILLKCRWRRSGAQSSSAPPSLEGSHSAPLTWSLPSGSLTCSNPLDTLPAQHLCGCPPCPRGPQGLSPQSPPSSLCSVAGSFRSLLFKTAIFLTPNLTPIGVTVLPSICCPIKRRL